MGVVGAGARLFVEARHGFQVVVKDVGQGAAEDVEGDLHAPAEVGNQGLDGGGRREFAGVADDVDEVLGAAVAQVVAVDAGNDHIFELESGDRLGEFARLVRVGRQGLAVADVTERAAPGADVAEDHEGRRAAPEALADVGAGGFLADGVQLALTQHGLDLAEAPGAVAGLDADPVGFLEWGVDRHDLDRDARGLQLALLLDAFLLRACYVVSHVVCPVGAAGAGRGVRRLRRG